MCKKYCLKCEMTKVQEGDFCKECLENACEGCIGIYKCDTGYGENRVRFIDENECCPVCNSDPKGEHREWHINYAETQLDEESDEEYESELESEIDLDEEDSDEEMEEMRQQINELIQNTTLVERNGVVEMGGFRVRVRQRNVLGGIQMN